MLDNKESDLGSSIFSSTIIYALIVAAIMFSWFSQVPSKSNYTDNIATQFSQQNALSHLAKITEHPRYMGSSEHTKVRAYLVAELKKLGIEVEVTKRLAQSSKYFSSGYVHNVIGRIKGSESMEAGNKALLLMSHYDSGTHSSYGASDAGSGVVTILETIRAFLESKPVHKNDIVVMFTDGEEEGLFGAEAFVAEHPWAQHIGLVINFEARGSGGPSCMLLETNGGNSTLINQYTQAGAPYPVGNSLMYSIYKMLPNDTDLTVFREQANINGFNFAFIDDHYDYHTEQDTLERLDLSSLNHQASYSIAMLNHFKDVDLTTLNSEQDNVFFNFANITTISYPFSWVWPLFVLAVLIWLAVTSVAAKTAAQPFKSLAIASLPAWVSVIVAGLLGYFGWQALLAFFPFYHDIPQGFTYNGHYLLAGFILLTSAFTSLLYRFFSHRVKHNSLLLSSTPVLFWLLVNLGVCIYLQGAGFLILLPLFAMLALIWQLFTRSTTKQNSDSDALLYCFVSLPGIVLFAPQIPVFVIGLGLSNLIIGTVFTALLSCLLFSGLTKIRGFSYLHWVLATLALICFAKAFSMHEYTPTNKKPNHLNYVYATDQKKAFLFSNTARLDTFLAQFFDQKDSAKAQLEGIFPSNRWRKPAFIKETAPLALSQLTYNAANTTQDSGRKHFSIQIQPQRQLNLLQLVSDQHITVHSMSVNDQLFKRTDAQLRPGFIFKHVMTGDHTVDIEFTYSSQESVNFRILGSQFNLIDTIPNIKARADNLMPHPFVRNDATIISQPIVAIPQVQ
jgi:Zn-dependent M28 family amino/carboxypeptidase